MLSGCVSWPPDLASRYRHDGYWRGVPLGSIARDVAGTDPERVAIVTDDASMTYGELDARADQVAAGMRRLGISGSDRVVVQLPSVPEFAVVCLALFRLGALPVLAIPAYRRDEIQYLCEVTSAVAYVIPHRWQGFDYLPLAREVRQSAPSLRHVLVAGDATEFTPLAHVAEPAIALPPIDTSDVAFFLLSGGTGGRPKLIPRTHDDYMYQLRATAEALRFDRHGVYLAALPIAHNAALGCPGVLGTLLAGAKLALAASPSPADVFPLVEREGVTLTTLISPLVALWVQAAALFGVRFPQLLLQVGGARLDPVVGRKIRSHLGCSLTNWFGMAEGLLCHTRLDDPDDVILSTQGHPLSPADELRVVDDMGRDVAAGEVGELLVRGPYTLRGYYNSPQYNDTAFTADGHLRTGDLVRRTSAGHLVVEGRIKDVINRGGEKIAPEELEQHLAEHPGVREAAVVSIPDPLLGERTCAFVVPRHRRVELDDVRSFLSARGLADYKLPDRLECTDAFPKTTLGKVDKGGLRDLAALGTTSQRGAVA